MALYDGVTPFLIKVVEVEHVAIEVSENVLLVQVLLAVQRELLTAHRTLPPVRLDMTLETALLKVRWENYFTQRTALMNISPETRRERERRSVSTGGINVSWVSKSSSSSSSCTLCTITQNN